MHNKSYFLLLLVFLSLSINLNSDIDTKLREETLDVDPDILELLKDSPLILKPKSNIYEIMGLPIDTPYEKAKKTMEEILGVQKYFSKDEADEKMKALYAKVLERLLDINKKENPGI